MPTPLFRQLYAGLREAILSTGLHVVGWLPPRRGDRLASQHIQRQGVDTPPLSAYHLAPPQRSGLVLGYAGVEPQAIRTAVEHIARALS
ncbi:hypothetical protein [Ktedonobacter racemifer]|uniref:Putative transcriptional regulator, GntR family n=1 Tax=Ktedonobacter racemifer DSM 44963 TaxID=485913 RepID=D6TBX7_KTERA|nr:hypothetical protein [Ktedonobacter racemifer]EFH88013.1 putative transcriptional regulator, GntR family [Ktedonobacter racemifer DSM 44963]